MIKLYFYKRTDGKSPITYCKNPKINKDYIFARLGDLLIDNKKKFVEFYKDKVIFIVEEGHFIYKNGKFYPVDM
jgi:hypothetical protein